MISKEIKTNISNEMKHKQDIEFLKSLGEYKILVSYWEREIEFYKELSEKEVKGFLSLIKNARISPEISIAHDFSYNTLENKDDYLIKWLDNNYKQRATMGSDGNHFSGWETNRG